MLFCSWKFCQFFLAVFAVYWLVPWGRLRLRIPLPLWGRNRPERTWVLDGHELRLWLLVAASFYFYASWNQMLALLICATTLMDYGIGLALEAIASPRWRRILLICSLVTNLGVLVYFKYANFFLESLFEALRAAGVHASAPVLHVLVPIGISFYTFEAINYTVDVWRRKVHAERNPAHLMLFVLFFPHLIAGPIVRARDFLPQMRRRKRWSWGRFQVGIEYLLLGLLKKWVVADQLATYADPVFAAPGAFGTSANWIALLAFMVQVYCDISGYSDMALGLAHLLGYKLTINFNMPYVSTSLTDYWRRNHISLSTWLRDYLFIPLGGSRGSHWQTGRALMITMVLGGLWHGASWNFALWGALHGFYLITNRHFRFWCEARPRLASWLQSAPGTALRIGLTLFCIYQGFVLFRAPTFAATLAMYQRLWVPAAGPPIGDSYGYGYFWLIVGGFAFAHVIGYCRWWEKFTLRMPAPVVGMAYVAALLLCMVLAPAVEKPFIYQFF
jgi:alginate O-acetyltransferase complex protein AlgI